MRRATTITLSLAAIAALSGCATPTTYDHHDEFMSARDQSTDQNREMEAITDQALKTKLTYFGKAMLSDSQRKAFIEELDESDQVKGWMKDAFDNGVLLGQTGSMVGDIASEQVGSFAGDQGAMVGLAAGFILSGLSSNQKDGAGQAMLPAEMYGRSLDTQEDAIWALNTLVDEKFQGIGEELSWDVECLKGCNVGDTTMTYMLSSSPEHPLATSFPYRHYENIGMTVSFVKPKRIEDNNPIQAFTDFDVEWVTGGERSFITYFYSLPDDFKSNPVYGRKRVFLDGADMSSGEKELAKLPEYERAIGYTPFGEALKASFHGSPFTYGGVARGRERMNTLAYNGAFYGFGSEDKADTRLLIPELETADGQALGQGSGTDNGTVKAEASL